MEQVEALDPGQAGDQRRVAEGQQGVDPVDEGASRIGRLARRRGGEHLDLVAALGLAPGEPVAGVAGAARVGREGRSQVGDPQAARS